MQVKYASLPNFEDREEEFMAESVLLRKRFTVDGISLPPSLHIQFPRIFLAFASNSSMSTLMRMINSTLCIVFVLSNCYKTSLSGAGQSWHHAYNGSLKVDKHLLALFGWSM